MLQGDTRRLQHPKRLVLVRVAGEGSSSRRDRFGITEVVLVLGGRIAGLAFGSLLLVVGLLAATSSEEVHSAIGSVGLIGAGATLLRFGGRPADLQERVNPPEEENP